MLNSLKTHASSLVSIAIRAGSVIAGFAITYYVGHSFGPLANGQYALITQTAMFLSIVAVGGMDLAIVRYFSAALAYKIPIGLRALLRPIGYSLTAALVILAILAVTHTWLLGLLFHGQPPAYGVAVLAMVLVARTITRVTAAVLRSLDRHLVAQCVEVLAIPTLVTLLLAFGLVRTLREVLYATAGVGLAVAAFGLWRVFRRSSRSPEALDVPFRSLFRTSLPLWLTVISLNIADWYSLATAATTLGVYEAGLFRVAFQIGGALSFSAMGIYNVFTARISAALAVGDIGRVARLSRSATRLSVVLLLPVVIGLYVFARPLFGLIGPQFVSAAPLLRIFLTGQLIYVASGPAGLVLAMTGHERLNLLVSASVTGALLVLAPIAATRFGLYGLSVLTACVPVLGNIVNTVLVWRLEHFNTITGRYHGSLPAPHAATEAEAPPSTARQAEPVD